jgi:hypothetical protein
MATPEYGDKNQKQIRAAVKKAAKLPDYVSADTGNVDNSEARSRIARDQRVNIEQNSKYLDVKRRQMARDHLKMAGQLLEDDDAGEGEGLDSAATVNHLPQPQRPK